MEKPKKKREDLQGIRGIAIISVILFHFLPSIFPNGYIGVDEFFVLSGYLMCQLLINQKKKKKKNKESSDICIFYIRRLKRILPLYFLILFLSIISIFTLFPFESIHLNVISAKNAALFISNRPKTEDEDYFQMLTSAMDVFTHTWSLSVEVQFYVIVPFIFFIGYHLFSTHLQIPYYFVLGLISYIYSVVFLTDTDAFYSVPARIWQFLIGMIAFLYTESHNISENTYQKLENGEKENYSMPERTNETNKNPLLILIFLLASFVPIEIPSEFLRPGITVMTGILMVSNRKSILESRILTYFGDISYSLYLIHWPIYAFWKSNYSQNDTWNSSLIISLEISILFAVLCFHTFEKWYLKQSDNRIFGLCGVLFLLIMGLLYQETIMEWTSPPSKITKRLDGLNDSYIVSYEEAAKLNKKWTGQDNPLQRVATCEYADKKAVGRVTVHIRLALFSCLDAIPVSACEPLHTVPRKACVTSVAGYEKYVREEKPDYLFILSRFVNIGDPMNTTKIDDDLIFKEMKTQIKKISDSVKHKIFVMHQFARPKGKMVQKMVEVVKEHKNLTEFDKPPTIKLFPGNNLIDENGFIADEKHNDDLATLKYLEKYEVPRTGRYTEEEIAEMEADAADNGQKLIAAEVVAMRMAWMEEDRKNMMEKYTRERQAEIKKEKKEKMEKEKREKEMKKK
uniref:Acyl_transf_3 domain-containing protein n=1 Tax=Caenorhabditis tropicalis TaxID=1561998 RepID=A0A1I7UI22_9PELO